MPSLKCPQCAREVPSDARTCPWDGTPINSVVVRSSLWDDKSGNTDTQSSRTRVAPDTAESPMLLPGRKLGDYEVGELLGSGGMGEVYAGVQPMIGKKVAIKVLKAEIAAEPGNVQRMLSEARAVNSIRHRSIVDIFNFATLPDGRPYLVMEYLEGTALDVMLREKGALPPHEVAEFLEEICSALAAAHAQGIVHRDLKPGNVFIVSSGNVRTRYVKLADFGLAKGTLLPGEAKQTRQGMVVGTPDYIAPEQAKGGTVTAQTDLYSLGVMAFEMVCGALPFSAGSVVELMMKHVTAAPPRVSSKIDFCPPALDALIFRLMSKSPGDRPESAEVVRLEIARIRREMREGETLIGVTVPPISAQTIRIPNPAADTPPMGPAPAPAPAPAPLPRPRSSAPRPPAPAPAADPTARFAAVGPVRSARGIRLKLAAGLVAVVAVAGAAGWWWVAHRPPPVVELPNPPPAALLPPSLQVGLDPAQLPPAAQPPVQPEPTPRPKAPVVRPNRPPPAAPSEGSPTREELVAEVRSRVLRMVKNKYAPRDVQEWEGRIGQRIKRASTLEERKKILSDMREMP